MEKACEASYAIICSPRLLFVFLQIRNSTRREAACAYYPYPARSTSSSQSSRRHRSVQPRLSSPPPQYTMTIPLRPPADPLKLGEGCVLTVYLEYYSGLTCVSACREWRRRGYRCTYSCTQNKLPVVDMDKQCFSRS